MRRRVSRLNGRVEFTFSFLGAAVFAEPTITKIEEVIGLVHFEYRGRKFRRRNQKSAREPSGGTRICACRS